MIFLFLTLVVFCSAERNCLCNYGTGHYKEHFKDISILQLSWLFRLLEWTVCAIW